MGGYFISKAVNVGENNSPNILTSIGSFEEENEIIRDRNRALGY